jgi:phosphoribosylglycinamide formyltransferase-1
VNLPRITVLISGRGSNLAALLAAERAGTLGGAVTAVVSNRPEAAGLAIAASHGAASVVVDHQRYARARTSTPRSPRRSTPPRAR